MVAIQATALPPTGGERVSPFDRNQGGAPAYPQPVRPGTNSAQPSGTAPYPYATNTPYADTPDAKISALLMKIQALDQRVRELETIQSYADKIPGKTCRSVGDISFRELMAQVYADLGKGMPNYYDAGRFIHFKGSCK